jgi:putative acetyltransferase
LSRFDIRPDEPTRPEIAALIARHLELMQSITPPESVHAVGSDTLSDPDTDFFSLRLQGQLLTVGALRRLGGGEGEIKSMHTLAEARGTGAGAAMLVHIMEHARATSLTRLSLETGSTEAFAPARRLYARHGFEACGPFGTYREDPHSAFMTRTL